MIKKIIPEAPRPAKSTPLKNRNKGITVIGPARNSQNEILGSVSGGCIESEVFIKALKVIKTEKPITLSFGISNSQAWGVGLTCGGKVKVFVEKILQ